ncbi:outer membrane beta-barrel protein [Solitalea lacus]|uniref:outer membrane beta-barrel protein n=1 Tax=Solitalea lacus TaxID=2911172 RepID=UPI001EDA8AAF|nr:outer membrane beta-barrel protein [Solitalea lacus]UKJ09203.1 outer membrane beta-barrel family protein [Solitalea lacus]
MDYIQKGSLVLISFVFINLSSYAQEKKPRELKEVTIIGNNKPLKETAKGVILDISRIRDVKLLTLAEILKTIPGIEVDNNGKVSYLGKELTILRDGVNVAGFSKQITNSLNSGITNNSYKKIELNLYDLKTEGPTLSFIATKYDEGYFGNVSGNAGSNSSMVMGNITLSQKRYLLNFSTSGNLQYTPSSESHIETYFNQTQFHEKRNLKMSGVNTQNYQFSIGNSFFINPQSTLNTSLAYGSSRTKYSIANEVQHYQNDVLNNNSSTFLDNHNPMAKNPNLGSKISFVYKTKTNETVNQRFDIALEYDNNNSLSETITNTQSLLNVFLPNSNYNSNNGTKLKNVFGLLGYEFNHDRLGDFEFVARYFNRKNYQSYDYTYQTDGGGNLANLFQDNNITYNYGALLASWSKSFEGISFQSVFKQDYSDDYITNLKGRDKFTFSTFSPYLSIQRSLKNGSIRIEAQYGESRPNLSNLTNIINYGAQYDTDNLVTIGNPYLKPSKSLYFSGLYNANIKGINHVLTGNYKYITDAISTFDTTDVNNVRIRTYRNLASRTEYNGSLTLNFYVLPRFTVQLFSNHIFGTYNASENETTNGYRWSNGFTLGYTPIPNIRLSANSSIGGGTNFQSKTKAQINTGLSASYSKSKLNFNLSINNFHQPYFNTQNWIYGYGYQTSTQSRSRRIMGSLSISYSLGNPVKTANINGKEIIKDDI